MLDDSVPAETPSTRIASICPPPALYLSPFFPYLSTSAFPRGSSLRKPFRDSSQHSITRSLFAASRGRKPFLDSPLFRVLRISSPAGLFIFPRSLAHSLNLRFACHPCSSLSYFDTDLFFSFFGSLLAGSPVSECVQRFYRILIPTLSPDPYFVPFKSRDASSRRWEAKEPVPSCSLISLPSYSD